MLLFCFTCVFIFIDAQLLKNKIRDNRRGEKSQRKYNDEVMKKPTININDRIYYNKVVTTPFLEEICPMVSDLVFIDETKLYEMNEITKEDFQNNMLQNISHAFLSDVYTSKNYPTHRCDITLNITINDIYKYDKNHCKKEYAKLIYLKKEARQLVHEYHMQKTKFITIEHRPYYHLKDYIFQKPLCPIIGVYKRMNESFSSHEKFVNSLVNNITQEYMEKIYTPKNFGKLYQKDTIVEPLSEHDINKYYKEHCKHLYKTNTFTYVSTIVLGSTAALLSIL
jgi:hypothetical protein